jgi:hypothetical protein
MYGEKECKSWPLLFDLGGNHTLCHTLHCTPRCTYMLLQYLLRQAIDLALNSLTIPAHDDDEVEEEGGLS